MTLLTIQGETFWVEVEGAADLPTVLLSNSLGSDLSLWDAQMPALLEHFRVIRYDTRGHGRSTIAGAPYSLARLGRDALAILDTLEIAKTHFVGISMGGAIGQWLLVNAPERLTRAVLANTVARFGTPDAWNGRIASVLARGTADLAQANMQRWFSEAFRKAEPHRVAAVEAVFRNTSPDGYAACCAALRDLDLREAIAGIERPVLVVTGRDDPVTSEADVSSRLGAIAGAQHLELDCKHISNVEAAAAFNAAVVKFLTAPARPARSRTVRKTGAPTRHPTAVRSTAARQPLRSPPAKSPTRGKQAASPAARVSSVRAKRAKGLGTIDSRGKATTPDRASPPKTPPRATTVRATKTQPKVSRPDRRKAGSAKRGAAAAGAASKSAGTTNAKKATGTTKKTSRKKMPPKKPTTRRRPQKTRGRPTGRPRR